MLEKKNVALCHVRFIPRSLQTNEHSCTPTSNLDLDCKKQTHLEISP